MFRKMREEINERNSTLVFFYDFFVQIDYFLTSEIQMRVTKACNSDFNRFMLFFFYLHRLHLSCTLTHLAI